MLACLCGLIFAGRDLGTPISLLVIAGVVFWTAGLKFRYFIAAGVLAAILITVAIRVEPFRKNRWAAFMGSWSRPPGDRLPDSPVPNRGWQRQRLGSGADERKAEDEVSAGGAHGFYFRGYL